MNKNKHLDLTVKVIYGDHLCHNCHSQQIVQLCDHDSPLIYSYRRNKAGVEIKDEHSTVGHSNKDDELGLCYYCKKVFSRLLDPDHPSMFNTQLRMKLKEQFSWAVLNLQGS